MKQWREQIYQMRKVRKLFKTAVFGVVLSTVALLAIPFLESTHTNELPVSYMITGALFWIGILIEIVFYIFAASGLRRYDTLSGEAPSTKRGFVGFFAFFRNAEARIADIAMFVSLAWLLITVLAKWTGDFAVMSSVILCFLSVQLHGILNGRVYEFVKHSTNHKKGEKNYEDKY